eukprot:CAMPEP_0177600220 /NCGR_PEP_ID=MMETSP0419_2-20121207/13486_1 /TAXON_ID=582737 /ORGANISM="Tetraselmis sp., Strain GSL018" /LENGTH=311 /DNA_ID=CAMNT_0019093157 /DNA_START=333 /DNA_END=1268 /DNA_ORIENTATION=+
MYNFRRNYSLSASSAPDERSPMKVLITGSGGKTGCLVLKKLLEKGDAFSVRGLVRTEQSAGKLANETSLSKDSIFVADVTQGPEALAEAMSGCEAVVLCTSAVPKLILWSLFPVLWSRLTGKGGVRPRFRYAEGQSPEAVDWVGARAQIDAAAAAGARKFVFLGSMGGTQTEENFLNTMGGGNVLLWKRKAEEHLIRSGLDYTIIHAGRKKLPAPSLPPPPPPFTSPKKLMTFSLAASFPLPPSLIFPHPPFLPPPLCISSPLYPPIPLSIRLFHNCSSNSYVSTFCPPLSALKRAPLSGMLTRSLIPLHT